MSGRAMREANSNHLIAVILSGVDMGNTCFSQESLCFSPVRRARLFRNLGSSVGVVMLACVCRQEQRGGQQPVTVPWGEDGEEGGLGNVIFKWVFYCFNFEPCLYYLLENMKLKKKKDKVLG